MSYDSKSECWSLSDIDSRLMRVNRKDTDREECKDTNRALQEAKRRTITKTLVAIMTS